MLIVSLSCGRGYTRDNDHTECVGGATQGTMIILSVCVGLTLLLSAITFETSLIANPTTQQAWACSWLDTSTKHDTVTRVSSQHDTVTRVSSQHDTVTRVSSQHDTVTRVSSQHDTVTRVSSQHDTVTRVSCYVS